MGKAGLPAPSESPAPSGRGGWAGKGLRPGLVEPKGASLVVRGGLPFAMRLAMGCEGVGISASAVPWLGKNGMQNSFESFIRRFIRHGSLEVETPAGKRIRAGDGSGHVLGLRFKDERAQWRLLADPELAFGELYMEGAMEVTRGTLLDVMQLTLTNLAQAGQARWLSLLHSWRTQLCRLAQQNDPFRARQNVAHHYDLDHRLYDLFLDADKQYSCAYFEYAGQSLEEAQRAKKRHIAAKLLIEPGQRVLDIGCGWGGMALYLTRMCEARVTGVTLSEEQLAIASRRAAECALAEPPEFHLRDYRAEEGRYQRIVSVGMFEHVGIGYYDAFFRKIADLLTDDGIALVHTIGRPDVPSATNPFIAKYIFPGGHLPSLSEIMPAIERSGLIATDVEILRLHYALTLQHWQARFQAHREEIARLYDERFCRMWEFYLAGSEATFRLGQAVNFQIQLAKRVDSVPLTRDYMGRTEYALRLKETSAQQNIAHLRQTH
jgi:cyclopropane-fatty-acyl-phospholipid synthase